MSNYFTKTIEWNGQLFETEITDTEGYDEYSIIPNGLLIGRRGYILVYSVGSRESFELVPVLRDKLFHYSVRAPPPPIGLSMCCGHALLAQQLPSDTKR